MERLVVEVHQYFCPISFFFNAISYIGLHCFAQLDKVPEDWAAYKLVPDRIEFWGQGSYIVDRIEYKKEDNGWSMVRLSSP